MTYQSTSRPQATALPTPSENTHLPQLLGGFGTLTEALDYAAKGETGFNFYSLKGELDEALPYSLLRERAICVASALAAQFERGSRACLVAETSADFLVTFFACQYAGIIPAPMPMPVSLGGKDGYILQIRQMMLGAKASAVIGPETLREFMEEAAAEVPDIQVLDYANLKNAQGTTIENRAFSAVEKCYIQYSSGSTSAPKGVIGTQHSVTSNLNSIARDGLQIRKDDRATNWLPLYHDMGLIGFVLTPMFAQVSVDFIATSDFVRRPLMWLTLLSRAGSTITYSPSFGYELAAKRAKKLNRDELDLSKVRVAGIGGDMVRPEALNAFADAFAEVGFNATAFTPSYGMAEATLAIAFSDVSEPVRVDHVDMQHYNRSGIAQPVSAITADEHKRAFVRCGQALPGHALEIRNERGTVTTDREVGRIFIKGPSITPGYFSDEAASNAMFSGEWLDTGDMGYTLDSDVVITGRAKDLIIINGRNIWPQDIEWAVETVENVRQGGVAAFSIDTGTGERIVSVVECRGGLDEAQRNDLHREIAQVIQKAAGAPAEVVLARPHSMVMTSSGKLSRARVRQKFLQGEFETNPDLVDAEPQAVNALVK